MRKKRPLIYYGEKLLALLLSVLVLSAAAFAVSRLAPGDPLAAYYGDRVEKLSPEQRAAAEARLGLDRPIPVQYALWLKNALHGDLGVSYKYKQDVLAVIASRLPNTLLLGGVGFALIFALSLALGLFCAWHEDKWPDRLLSRVGTVLSCVPEFWLGLALILVFAVYLRWLPSSGAWSVSGGGGVSDRIWHLILPMTVVVTEHLWYYAYMVRNKLLEEVRAEYVLLAKATGQPKRTILFRHCLRNVFPSYLSVMAVSVPHILGGTYIVETVFSYPGIGTLSYESARYKDYNLLMVLCVLSGILVILSGIAAQIISERIDPRVRAAEAVPDGEEADQNG